MDIFYLKQKVTCDVVCMLHAQIPPAMATKSPYVGGKTYMSNGCRALKRAAGQ